MLVEKRDKKTDDNAVITEFIFVPQSFEESKVFTRIKSVLSTFLHRAEEENLEPQAATIGFSVDKVTGGVCTMGIAIRAKKDEEEK